MFGEYHGHSTVTGNFVYLYVCADCGRKYRSSAPEESDPVQCHTCFTGGDRTQFLREQRRQRVLRKPLGEPNE